MSLYLLSGGAGFIGTNFAINFLKNDKHKSDTLLIDKFSYCSNNLVNTIKDKRLIVIKEDLLNYEAVNKIFSKFKIDYIINMASLTHVDYSIISPLDTYKNNTLLTLNLIDLGLKHKVKRFHQVSTDEVYGSTSLDSSYRYKESDALNPTNPYSASKASQDLLVLSYHITYGMDVTISRCSNNYGKYQYEEKFIPKAIKSAKKFIPKAIKSAKNNEAIKIYGEGKNVRDWIDVNEHVRAIDFIIDSGKSGEIYNVSTHNEFNNLKVAKMILDILKKDESLLSFTIDRLGHDLRYALDTTKIEKLGFKFKHEDFYEGLVKLCK